MPRQLPWPGERTREPERAGATTPGTALRHGVSSAGDATGKRILVVDDHAQLAAMTRMVLEWAGHSVEVVPHGWLALARAERFQPEVVICDLNLPDIEGMEIARRLRAAPWGRSMRLIACTGAPADDLDRDALAAGFDAFLAKPIDVPRLLAAIAAEGRPGIRD